MKNLENKERITVDGIIFRKSTPIDCTVERLEANYKGFKQEKKVLKKGTIVVEGYGPLPCDIIFERDVPVKLRDGVTMYTDIFRPVTDEKVPAVVSWSGYGKNGSGNMHLDYFGPLRIDKSKLTGLQKFEGADPGFWCSNGYAVCNPDPRGVFMSQGNIYFLNSKEGEDAYDYTEWLAEQEWCSGKTGYTGNSYLALSQWRIAAAKPPHLTAIAPWEGMLDIYKEVLMRGGVKDPIFSNIIIMGLFGNNYTEDAIAMLEKYPMYNEYWQDKAPDLTEVTIPAYVVASYTSPLHVAGTFKAYTQLGSKDKWLRVHDSQEWPDYYAHQEDLKKFFDRYLKGIENSWEKTPKVRLSVLDNGGQNIVDRPEDDYPLPRTKNTRFYLDASNAKLSMVPVLEESTVSYNTDSNDGVTTLTFDIEEDLEFVGLSKLKLWVESSAHDNIDLFAIVKKLSASGEVLAHHVVRPEDPELQKYWENVRGCTFYYTGPYGSIRTKLRYVDENKSTETEPFLTFDRYEPIKPGEIVPVEIPIIPGGMVFHKGEKLQLTIASYDIRGPVLDFLPTPETDNKGDTIIHTGGKFDSYIVLPITSK